MYALLLVIGTFLAPGFQERTSGTEELVKKLAFLEGRWIGTGKMIVGRNESRESKVTETARFAAGGQVLLLEGRGVVPNEQGGEMVVHDACAFIWHDAMANQLKMKAFRAAGSPRECEIEVKENKIIWGFEDPRAGRVRFSIEITGDSWSEIGEASRDGGKTWFRFFEMKLKKVGEKDKP